MADPNFGFKLAQQGIQLSNARVDTPYKFPPKLSTDPNLGFNLAREGVNLSKGIKSYRYPLAALSEKNGGTDYLEVKIIEYSAPGFDSPQGSLRLPTGTEKNSRKVPLAYIILPIPQNLSDSNSVDWGDNTTGAIPGAGVGAIMDVLKSSNPVTETASQVQNLISTALNTIKTGEGQKLTTALVSSALVNSLGANNSLESVLSRSTGQVINPNLELLFNGVTLRNFQFSFDFAPRSPEEAEQVKQIIRLFKKHMSAKNQASSGNGLLIKAPEVFQLTFKSGSSDHPFLFKFKPTALLGINVDYNASGQYATYRDGTPVHMSMNLTFKELNPIYSEDYDSADSGTGVGY